MNLKTIAALIPAEYQDEILKTNMVAKAVASPIDANMVYLATVWKNYVDPSEDLTCALCMTRILKNFRELSPTFVELTKKRNLLKSA